jgi:hypothetical protein
LIAPSVCPFCRSHAPNVDDSVEESFGLILRMAEKARIRAFLSSRVKALARSRLGRPCIGAGSHDGPSRERCPPGSIMVMARVQ